MRRSITGALVLVVLASCQTTERPRRRIVEPEAIAWSARGAGLDLTIRTDGEARAGEPVEVGFTLLNDGSTPVILQRFWAEGARGGVKRWFKSKGDLRPEGGGFRVFESAEQRGAPVIGTGLLMPGEARNFSIPIVFDRAGRREVIFNLCYFSASPSVMAENLYAPRRDQDGTLRFVPVPLRVLESWMRDGGTPREILYDDFTTLQTSSWTSRVFQVEGTRLTPEEAFDIAGFRTNRFFYAPWEEGWILVDDRGLFLVRESAVRPLKGIDESGMQLVSSLGPAVPFYLSKMPAEEVARVFEGRRTMSFRGIHVTVPRERFLHYLDRIVEAGYRVVVTEWEGSKVLGLAPGGG